MLMLVHTPRISMRVLGPCRHPWLTTDQKRLNRPLMQGFVLNRHLRLNVAFSRNACMVTRGLVLLIIILILLLLGGCSRSLLSNKPWRRLLDS